MFLHMLRCLQFLTGYRYATATSVGPCGCIFVPDFTVTMAVSTSNKRLSTEEALKLLFDSDIESDSDSENEYEEGYLGMILPKKLLKDGSTSTNKLQTQSFAFNCFKNKEEKEGDDKFDVKLK